MNIHEAHHLLNKRKQGFAVPLYIVNRALVVSGDLGMACLPCQATRVEGSGMAQGEGIGVMPDIPLAWDNPRFDQHHEGKE